MAIINKATKGDGHGNTIEDLKSYEEKEYTVNGMPSPIHFYYLNEELITGNETIGLVNVPKKRSLAPLTNSTGIMSVNYVPFMPEERLVLHKYNYDQSYYGNASSNPDDPADRQTGVFVYKVMNIGSPEGPTPTPYMDYELKQVDKYPSQMQKKKGSKHWSNESKLFQYPYYYATLNDYMNAPLQIRMDLIDGSDKYSKDKKFQVKVRQSLSINGTYTLYVPYLKGDATGAMEGMKSVSPMDLPVASSQYAQYMANNKSQHTVNNVMAITNSLLGNNGRIGQAAQTYAFGQQMVDNSKGWTDRKDQYGYAPVFKNNIGERNKGISMKKAALGSVAGEVASRLTNTATTIAQMYAKRSDMMNAPRNISLQGGDVMDAITNGNRKVDVIRYHLQEEYLKRLGDFFAMYGYKQNKTMKIDLRSRHDYNYIKTVGANIISKGQQGVPKKHIESLKAIFNNGITLWHMDRNGGKFIDYSDDNTEV